MCCVMAAPGVSFWACSLTTVTIERRSKSTEAPLKAGTSGVSTPHYKDASLRPLSKGRWGVCSTRRGNTPRPSAAPLKRGEESRIPCRGVCSSTRRKRRATRSHGECGGSRFGLPPSPLRYEADMPSRQPGVRRVSGFAVRPLPADSLRNPTYRLSRQGHGSGSGPSLNM